MLGFCGVSLNKKCRFSYAHLHFVCLVGCFRFDRCFIFYIMLGQPQKVGFMSSRHKHILVFFGILGVFLVPVGDIMTIQGRFAKGDDSSIYLVDFDETDYDLYIDCYYPSDYTYDDFRRDSIEGMVSHYVATDNNNFSAVVDTIENDVLQNGWSVIKDFFVDSWIDLKSGVITVAEGLTDDFKHELDGRFKITPPATEIDISGHTWLLVPFSLFYGSNYTVTSTYHNGGSTFVAYYTRASNSLVMASWEPYQATITRVSLSDGGWTGLGQSRYTYSGIDYQVGGINSAYPTQIVSQYSSNWDAYADFYSNFDSHTGGGDPYWSGDGYYSNTPTDYSINLPALPAIDWQSISNNNKNAYGVDFPDVDLTVDFQLPDSYYPQTVTYDTPYWLYNTDSTPADWANVSFDDVTLPEVQLSDGDGSFFQALFNTLPLAFVPILLGVILCYLIFLML